MIRTFGVSLFLVCLSLFMAPALSLADNTELAGDYLVMGWDPGSDVTALPDYSGKATLRIWGDVLSYRGFMDGMTYAGAALYDEEAGTVSLSFTNVEGSERGVTLLKRTGSTLKGEWVMDNGGAGKTGMEIWTKK